MASGTGLEMTQRKKKETKTVNELVESAAKRVYGRSIRLRKTWITDQDIANFEETLFSEAKVVDGGEPKEHSAIPVDVNKKEYFNHQGDLQSDETVVKIIHSAESAQAYNYRHQLTNGLELGANANIGLQIGLPQIGVGASGGVGGDIKKRSSETKSHENTQQSKVGQETHHEERIQIPAGKKLIVSITTYNVRYRTVFRLEFKIAKTKQIRISFGRCLGICCCVGNDSLDASQILQELIHREDEEFVYIQQDYELCWTTEKTEVQKNLLPV